MTITEIRKDLKKNSNLEHAKIARRFFKTSPGQYGYGDHFLGIRVPVIRKIVSRYQKKITLDQKE